MAAQDKDDVRLRFVIEAPVSLPRTDHWYTIRTLTPADAPAVHALLCAVFDDEEPDFSTWWAARSGDIEFEPALCFLAFDNRTRLAGAAFCWSAGFIRDLGVMPFARGKGLGEALMRTVFLAFAARGIGHVDLKTHRIKNATAYRLYRRLGMQEVDWEG